MKQFTTTDGKQIERVSRWIQIKTAYNMRKNNSLYDLGDEDGENGFICDYFMWRGRKWPLCQFVAFGSIVLPCEKPISFYENGEEHILSAVDVEDYSARPLMLELDEYGERVRLYY